MRNRAVAMALSVCVVLVAGCGSDTTSSSNLEPAAYREALGAICTTAKAASEAAEQPVGNDGVAEFATTIAEVITVEADRASELAAPDELDADHRAFVRNTDEQADLWRQLAVTDPDDAQAFGALRTEILELTLGRDDLVESMDIAACVRSAS